MLAIMLTLAQSGCIFEFGDKLSPTVIEPAGAARLEILETPQGEIIEPLPEDQCWVRAKHFHGLVEMSCEAIARQSAP